MFTLFDSLETLAIEDDGLQQEHLLSKLLSWDGCFYERSKMQQEATDDLFASLVWSDAQHTANANHLTFDQETLASDDSTEAHSQDCKPDTISTGKKLEMKKMLKKSPSAYNLFIKDKFESSEYAEMKKMDSKELMNNLSKEWKGLSAEARKTYTDRSKNFKLEHQLFNSKTSKNQKLANKLKPKQPVSPFTRFSCDERKNHPEMFKGLGLEVSTKLLSEKWKSLDPKLKESYQKKYELEKVQYKKEVENFKVKLAKGEKLEKKKLSVHQPFIWYLRDTYNSLKQSNPDKSHQELLKLVGHLWVSLPQSEKNAYYQKPASTSSE